MFDFRPTPAVLRCRPENLHQAFVIQRLSLQGKDSHMSGNTTRFVITIATVSILACSILLARAHFDAPAEAAAVEAAAGAEIASAAAAPAQQGGVGAEQFLLPASGGFEPFLLLILGSVLLSIGTVIKMLLTRKLKQR